MTKQIKRVIRVMFDGNAKKIPEKITPQIVRWWNTYQDYKLGLPPWKIKKQIYVEDMNIIRGMKNLDIQAANDRAAGQRADARAKQMLRE